MLQVFVIEPQARIAPLLKAHKEIRVVGSAASTDAVLYRAPACDLILASGALPTHQVLRFVQQCPPAHPPVVIVEIDETENEIVPLLEAGAVGYVRQGASTAELVETLHAIYSGKPPFAPPIGTALVARMHELLALQNQRITETMLQNSSDLSALTSREREILLLIRNSASNQEIANQLMIELGTVKNHVHNILKKLNVSRREQAAQYVDLLEQLN